MADVRGVRDMDERNGNSLVVWVVAFVLILALLTLGFFAYRNDWLGVGSQPQREAPIEQPTPQQPPAEEPPPEQPPAEEPPNGTGLPGGDTTSQPTTP